jgi:VWFA-related protein
MRRALILLTIAPLLKPQTPRIHVDTRLVEVNVIVRDKNNRPVEGLTKSDFKIWDRDKPQNISMFSAISLAQPPRVFPALPPGIYTNRPEQLGGAPPAITVVLLDALNTELQDQARAKQEFMKFLRQLRPEDRVAIYVLGRQLRVLHDFTNDTRSLLDVLAKYSGSIPSATVGSGGAFGGWLEEKSSPFSQQDIINRVHDTVAAMEAISNHIGHLGGRKNLIWITGSFPFILGGPLTFAPATQHEAEIARAVRAMNDANIAVYPVDAHGVITTPGGIAAVPPPLPSAPRNVPRPRPSVSPESVDTMNLIAQNTGGRAFYNTNAMDHAIRDAIDDAQLTYTLAFYADASARESEFRKLKVEVDRKGVELRYRRGYLAMPAAPASQDDREAAINDAIWSPLDAASISLAGRVTRLPAPNADSVQVVLSADPAGLTFPESDGKFNLSVEFTFALLSKGGAVVGAVRQEKVLDLTAEQHEQFMKNFVVDKTIELYPETAQMRVVLLDRNSGRLGSLTLPVK